MLWPLLFAIAMVRAFVFALFGVRRLRERRAAGRLEAEGMSARERFDLYADLEYDRERRKLERRRRFDEAHS